jgi:plasmid stabilization system protein ParE
LKKLGVIISPAAQIQYLQILEYLKEEWPEKVKDEFENLVDQKINLVAQFPKSCKESRKKKGVFKAVIEKHNSFFYRANKENIEVLIFVDNRMDPRIIKEQLKKYGK